MPVVMEHPVPGELGEFARTAVLLDEHFPGDPSLLAALARMSWLILSMLPNSKAMRVASWALVGSS